MAAEEEVRREFSGTRICFGEELDEALCINYQPGMLAEIEDALNEERDRSVAEQFFSEGCAT